VSEIDEIINRGPEAVAHYDKACASHPTWITLADLPDGVAVDRDGTRFLLPGYPMPDGWEWWSGLNACWRPFRPEWRDADLVADEVTAVRPGGEHDSYCNGANCDVFGCASPASPSKGDSK